MNDPSAADALRDLIDRTGRRYAVKMSGSELYKVADLAQKVLAERDQLHTLVASLADAQSRIDDADTVRPGDHDCAERLEVLLQAAAERLLTIEHLADLDRWRDWHDQHCDGDDCTHYESPEED